MKISFQIGMTLLLCAIATNLFGATTEPAAPTTQASPLNLALNKPATGSSTESDEHTPSKAVDADEDTRWCADGPDAPQWLQIDLQKPSKLSGCEVHWEMDEKLYTYVVEGSADATTWKILSDQGANTEKTQVQNLKFTAEDVRYIRVRVTGLEDGSWASICEFKVFGEQ